MANVSYKLPSLLPIFLTLFLSLPTVTEEASTNTSLFDVQASIQKTLDVFSAVDTSPAAEEESLHEDKQTTFPSSSSWKSFPLRSRLAVRPTREKDYGSLVAARLARDSARVKSIQVRLNRTVNGWKTEDEEKNLAPVESGLSLGMGEYFAKVGNGAPAKDAYMVVDTGSDFTWIQCQPCSNCYTQKFPIFNPSDSSTFSSLRCDSGVCRSLKHRKTCRRNAGPCGYNVRYADGSTSAGELVTETITFRGSAAGKIAIGCGHNNAGVFVGADGSMGLGRGGLSLCSQMSVSSLSYCLVDHNSKSESTLDFNPPIPAESVFAPLLKSPPGLEAYYYAALTGVSVGHEGMIKISPGGGGRIIVDSGTAVTRLPGAVYSRIRDAFVRLLSNNGNGPRPSGSNVALFDTCYDLAGTTGKIAVPTVSFHFTDKITLNLPPSNILVAVDTSGTHCFAFAPATSAIMGNLQQQGMRVTYDLDYPRVGFVPSKC
ncbi:unnamed protein product [Cuscuta europaea]|uniref:Peptidase A1 domain-containing protein n=1 Tax=Cuscuta europaea TaxID=41803 RepID=A0A9P0ZLT7_CUSEU|nr:unnamed protein product [Cuscuta europaea]